MKKMFASLFSGLLLLIISIGIIVYTRSDYAYSKQLVNAIHSGDHVTIQRILSEKPTCINSLTTPVSKTLCSVFDYRPIYPLIMACGVGDMDTIKLLIEHGADVNCNDGRTPLSITYAAKKENWFEISMFLIGKGASLDYQTEYSGNGLSVFGDILQKRPGALLEGYVAENADEVMFAFQYAMDHLEPSQVNWSRVMRDAVSNDRYEIVTLLIVQNLCDVNDSTSGRTPLMYAARDSDVDMVKLLLSFGADPSIVSADGNTAFDDAVLFGNLDIAAVLAVTTLPE